MECITAVMLDKPKFTIVLLQTILEKNVSDLNLIAFMADSCVLMEMKRREQCSFQTTRKFKSLTSRYWSKPAATMVAIAPEAMENAGIIRVNSIVKLLGNEGPNENAVTVVILAVFTKYNGKFWMRGQQEEADLMKATGQNRQKKEMRFLVQHVSIDDDGDVFVHVPIDEDEVNDVFGLVKSSEVGDIIGFQQPPHQSGNNLMADDGDNQSVDYTTTVAS